MHGVDREADSITELFKTFKSFKALKPSPLSFPATRGRIKEGG